MREQVIDSLGMVLKDTLSKEAIDRMIEIPPSEDLGDFAFPCFPLARILRKNPVQIAEELRESIRNAEGIEKVEAKSGYLNIFIDKRQMAERVLKNAGTEGFGSPSLAQRVVVEFASPNTNKPLHLGHLRNMAIGESVSRILRYAGNQVVKASINNDRGVHICKSMLAYQKLGNGITPEQAGKKPDHLVGDFYVLFNQQASVDSSWNDQAQEMLRQWEAGDEEVVRLWRMMNGWALGGFRETYALFGIQFDKEYFESEIYKKGKEIVAEGLDRGVFRRRPDGAVVIDLEAEKLGEKVLLRPDGTSVYIVQDLYLAVLKDQDYHYDKSIYVVGNEQEYHFAVLIAILGKLGYSIAGKMKHLSYGMVELPEGKMKSREGTVVDADDLIRETQELARAELKERYSLGESDMEERSLKIALSAIKYQLLKIDITKNMVFDPRKAISFEGDTGPYLLYSYARASSILRKSSGPASEAVPPELLTQEVRLLKKLDIFPGTLMHACEHLAPSAVATYAFECAQVFNEFYHSCPVIGSDQEGFRLRIVSTFRKVLKTCLHLLSIDEIEEM